MNSRDTIYATLRDRLVSGYYDDDASLIPLPLSEEFAVSRTPVREALGLLERDGLLTATQRGFTIRKRSDEEILEIFEVRAILDSSSAFAAATRRSPIDIARLTELVARGRSETDPAGVRQSFNLFHDALRHAAHNETILTLVRMLDAQVKISAPWKTQMGDETFSQSNDEHELVLEAIRDGDGELARTRMLAHLAHDRDTRILQLVAQMARPDGV